MENEDIQKQLEQLPVLAKQRQAENKKYFAKLKKKPPKNLDYLMQELHEQTFAHTNCLECANCCKTTGPLFTNADITRIAKHLRMKEQQFIEIYLQVDQDNDHVLKELPCSFLGSDNYCTIYEVRPKACREYPHTDRKKFHQIASLTIKNTTICPAAYEIVEKMKKSLPM
ncbi:YkgJ family cysteine cluster protein [Galbibacter sp.]|jgi:Fe-S-cluster containining protein|uniref:YkgJ family cysteine cluster protein n=1 Tax=Galbibacter sp. TaxID=2918471 RepID=UPI003A947509